jgi:integrase
MDEIQRPPKPQHLPRPYTPDEMRRIMQLELPSVESVIRGLLYYTGLRVSPICALKVGDLSFDEIRYPTGVTFPGTIRTIGKGNKPLVTPMHPALSDPDAAWARRSRHHGGVHESRGCADGRSRLAATVGLECGGE